MLNAIQIAQKHGIRIGSATKGAQKTTCPRCSSKRVHVSDHCLSVRIDQTGIGWRCFHCGWTGGEMTDAFRTTSKMVGKTRDQHQRSDPYGALLRKARAGWASSKSS